MLGSTKAGDEGAGAKRRLMAQIARRHLVRLQMTFIVLASVAASIVVSKTLHALGVGFMTWRYPLAILSAYLVFLLGVRLWLRYAGFDGADRGRGNSIDVSDVGNVDFGSAELPAGRGGSTIFSGQGGGFGGAGASESFVDGSTASGGWFSGGGGSSSGSGGLDIDGDGVVAILLIGLVFAAVVGAGGYLIYEAPSILADAAFQMILAGGLARRTKRMEQADWASSVVKSTWMFFAAILVAAMVFAIYAGRAYPEARTMTDVARMALHHGG